MPRIERTAHVTWEGNVARGRGHISGDTGAFSELPFSLPTRIGAAEGKTSPEELLAAAHGGCITMSLASELSQAGTATFTCASSWTRSRGRAIRSSPRTWR
jgi:osmotically inducible protein OsmC